MGLSQLRIDLDLSGPIVLLWDLMILDLNFIIFGLRSRIKSRAG